MKGRFPGYYRPTQAELDALWQEGTLVVLDTNILLHLYRVPASTRTLLLSILERLKDRLWIPHQVGIEYQRRRLGVIRDAFSASRRLLTDIEKAHEQFKRAVQAAQPDKRGLRRIPAALTEIQTQVTRIRDDVHAAIADQLSPTADDFIREAIDALIGDKVGAPPESQEVLAGWYKQGAARFALQMGPGYKDAKKANSPSPKFFAGGLTFEGEYGDLVLWKQIIQHTAKEGIKKVVFVTQDNKEDWWCHVSDPTNSDAITQGPLQELAEEIRREGGVDLFWMYHLQEFMEAASERFGINVSEEAITDVSMADKAAATTSATLLPGPISVLAKPRSRFDVQTHLLILEELELTPYTVLDGFSVGTSFGRPEHAVILTSHDAIWGNPFRAASSIAEIVQDLNKRLELRTLDVYVMCARVPDAVEENRTLTFVKDALSRVQIFEEVSIWTCLLRPDGEGLALLSSISY
ncbi:PIN-like domain-containing protein [Stenotrophomonas sepilia]|uniref:PIN-like domain-containing protein n=1 Tax=Stenotrophomonas sepilia TaxID=2860290 RepID=UPI002E782815|nr:PIN-like domain-containing protein [Stenotrophomonas sepilia]